MTKYSERVALAEHEADTTEGFDGSASSLPGHETFDATRTAGSEVYVEVDMNVVYDERNRTRSVRNDTVWFVDIHLLGAFVSYEPQKAENEGAN